MNMFNWLKKRPKRKYIIPKRSADVVIVRGPSTNEGTFGELRAGIYCCKTCELPDRGNARDFSCIPPGRYVCRPYKSKRFGDVYIVEGVDGRTYILTHSGNVAGDKLLGLRTHSAGCILLGKYFGRLHGQKAVMCSRSVVRQFKHIMGYSPFILEIREV